MDRPINPRFIHVMSAVHRALYRLTGGAIGASAAGMPNLLLTTTGRKSGQPRTVPLLYLMDGDRYVLVASYGGAAHHPAWWLNLLANPEATIQIRKDTYRVTARESTDEEREVLWPKVVDLYRSYEDYAQVTQRKIPVVILEPAS